MVSKEPYLHVHELTAVPGCIAGLTSSSCYARIELHCSEQQWLSSQALMAKLVYTLAGQELNVAAMAGTSIASQFGHLVLNSMLMFQQKAGLPVFTAGSCFALSDQCVEVIAASFSGLEQKIKNCLADWLDLLQGCLRRANGFDHGVGLSKKADEFAAQLVLLGEYRCKGQNNYFLLKAAAEMAIQVTPLVSHMYRFGLAGSACRLLSTLTPHTSYVATTLAKHKAFCAQELAKAGIPVARHRLVSSVEEACDAAERIGYPVVIKPVSLSQGLGVVCEIMDKAELMVAAAQSLKMSSLCMVEQHIYGEDFRILVFRGEVLWVTHRTAAAVVGDGVHTVAQLMHLANQDPRRGTSPEHSLKLLRLDEDMKRMLAKQGMNAESVPQAKQLVRLRSNANTSSGGIPIGVTERIHPDNARLAAKIAGVAGLDFAGIDVLMPDISRSWLDVGASVCEVNAQPQISQATGPHLFGLFLQRLMPNRGRVPVILSYGVLNSPAGQALLDRLYQPDYPVVGVLLGQRLYVDGCCDSMPFDDLWSAGSAMLADPRVEMVVLDITESAWLGTGLPFCYADALLVNTECRDVHFPSWFLPELGLGMHYVNPNDSEQMMSLLDRLSAQGLVSCVS